MTIKMCWRTFDNLHNIIKLDIIQNKREGYMDFNKLMYDFEFNSHLTRFIWFHISGNSLRE